MVQMKRGKPPKAGAQDLPVVHAYLRVSTHDQDIKSQELAIRQYAEAQGLAFPRWHCHEISSRKSDAERGVEALAMNLRRGDTLIVSELSRLGRSAGKLCMLIQELVERGVNFVSVKQGIRINGTIDMQTKIMVSIISLFAELERDFISERTKMGLAAARAKGKKLGRPKGSCGRSKLDPYLEEIKLKLSLGVSKVRICADYGCSGPALASFIKSRQL